MGEHSRSRRELSTAVISVPTSSKTNLFLYGLISTSARFTQGHVEVANINNNEHTRKKKTKQNSKVIQDTVFIQP